jgi:DNA-binding MurR/RpiR family transcriptional regulator
VLDAFAAAGIEALERSRHSRPAERLDQALDLLAAAEVIRVARQRRAFPVTAYLSYLVSQLDRLSHLLDSVGGMLEQQARSITTRGLLLAVSFRSYAPEVLSLRTAMRAPCRWSRSPTARSARPSASPA